MAQMDSSSAWLPMVGPKELLDKVAPTPTQAGGDESQVVTLALRLIAGIEGVAFCALPVVAARINAEGRGSARKHYDGRKTAPVVRKEGVITSTVGTAREGLMCCDYDLVSIMDCESAQRRMVGCDGDAYSQTWRRRGSLL